MADFNSGRVWAAWATPGINATESVIRAIEQQCDNWRSKGLVATDAIGGWPGGFLQVNLQTKIDPSLGMRRLVEDKYREAFERAQFEANEQAQGEHPSGSPQVDPYLHCGGLANKSCGYVLQVATGEVIFPPQNGEERVEDLWKKYKIDYIAIHYAWSRTYLYWSPDKVAELAKKADWRTAKEALAQKKANPAILFSARTFLDTCALLNLGIRFASQ